MDTSGWDELVARARAGEPYAMDDLLAAVRPLVLRRCGKFLPYRHDAEEAAQEALMTIATRLDDFTGRGSLAGWVTVIASNTARMTYRSMRRRFADTTTDAVGEASDPRTTSVIAGTRLDLLDALEQLERDHPAAVEAFVLRDLGSLPYDEIAALTDVPVGTVKTRVRTARGYIREKMSPRPQTNSAPGASDSMKSRP